MKKTLLFLLVALFASSFSVKACDIKVVLHDRDGYGWVNNQLSLSYTDEYNNSHDISLSFTSGKYYESEPISVKDGSIISWAFNGASTTGFHKWFVLYFDLSSDPDRDDVTCFTSDELTSGDNGSVEIDCDYVNIPRTINVINTEGGLVEKHGNDLPGYADTLIATPTPNSGYRFAHWICDDQIVSLTSTYIFHVDMDATYEAVFVSAEGELIGDGNELMDTVYLPSYTYYTYSISQQIYTTDEVNPGEIISIAMYNSGVAMSGDYIPHYDIYMLNTDKSSFTSDDDWLSANAGDLVYSGDLSLEYATWTVITLDQSFTLLPDNNLAIIIISDQEAYEEGEDWGQQRCRVYNTSGLDQAISAYNDDDEYDPSNPSGSSSDEVVLMSVKNQLILNYNYPTTYNVNVTADPTNGGNVTGAGIYNAGQNCTLTATPVNNNYHFLGWMENDEIIYDNPYNFTVNEDRNLVAKFYTYHWSYNVMQNNLSMVGIIEIDGVEQSNPDLEIGAFCGDECRGSMLTIPEVDENGTHYVMYLQVQGGTNPDPITFRLYDHRLPGELDDLRCENEITFVPEAIYPDPMSGEYYYVFEFSSKYTVSATVNPDGAGSVTGTGEYYIGDNAELTVQANDGFVFKNWLVGDNPIPVTDNPLLLTVDGNISVVANFDYVETTPLQAGWTWWSTAIATDASSLTMLENSLGTNGILIKSMNSGFVQYRSNTNSWTGSLSSINNRESYNINVGTACNAQISGQYVDPSSVEITINPGWNWIGYPVHASQNPNVALQGFTPKVGDILKSQDNGFVMYRNSGTWLGSLSSLNAGYGYKYYSGATEPKPLVYAVGGGKSGDNQETTQYWKNNAHLYQDNMCMIVAAYIFDEEQNNENLEMGAFVNGECRGRARLMYFEELDRCYAFLTVAGENGDKVEFCLVDTDNNRISGGCLEEVVFATDAVYGNLEEPFKAHFSGMNEISRSQLIMFPNPVERNSSFVLNIPTEEKVNEIVITNALGAVVKNVTTSLNIVTEGLPMSGVYMVKAICNSGNVYKGKLIVK